MSKVNNSRVWIWVAGVGSVIAIFSLIGSYAFLLINQNMKMINSGLINGPLFGGMQIESPGVFGDSFGIFAALFSGLAFAGLIVTILLQREDLNVQREELELTREEIKKQSFEGTFFQMLRLHNDILNSIDLQWSDDSGTRTKSGRDCFVSFFKRLREEYKSVFVKSNKIDGPLPYNVLFEAQINKKSNEAEIIESAYRYFWAEHKVELGHYFRYLFNVFKFVKDSDIEDKEKYTGIVKAQLSDQELALLFYNCLTEHGRDNFYPMVNDYHLIDNMPSSLLFNKYHVGFYEKRAYKTNKEMIELYDKYGGLEE